MAYTQTTWADGDTVSEARLNKMEAGIADAAKTADQLSAQVAANVSASTDADADYAAEVVDARADALGKTHDSMGDHARSIGGVQVFQDVLDVWTMKQGYIDSSGNYRTASESSEWRCWQYIPVTGGKVLVSGRFGYLSGNDAFHNIWCYDSGRNSLGGAFRAENGVEYGNKTVVLPDDTAYISVVASSTYRSGAYKSRVYLMPDLRPAGLLNNYASTWQGINGQVAVTFSTSDGTVSVEVGKTSYLCRVVNGDAYKQTAVTTDSNAEFDFTPSAWWAIYWQDSTDDDWNDTSGWAVETTDTAWGQLFTADRFVLAVFYASMAAYIAPLFVSSSNYFTINGVEYGNVASELSTIQGYSKYHTHTAYLSNYYSSDKPNIAVDIDAGTVQVTGRVLAIPDNRNLLWLNTDDDPYAISEGALAQMQASPATMVIFGIEYSGSDSSKPNFYTSSEFQALGENGYYVAAFWKNQFYFPHMSADVVITLNGTSYDAGDLFVEDSTSSSSSGSVYDDDGISDIAIPTVVHCMEGHQLSCYYDSISRFEGSENLYRFVYSTDDAGTTIKRNELCWTYTPGSDISDFAMSVYRLSRADASTQETKDITIKVNHPLTTSITKNVCLLGDSLVDNSYLAKEVWDLLDADGDCVINHIGTRGGTGNEHEGRSSWSWYRYLQGDDYANRSNAFWNTDDDCLDFQWYCAQHGYDGIDYMLIALGTNDVTQGTTAYRTFAALSTIISRAKQFVDILLSEDRGFPNCKVGIGLIGPGADYGYLIETSMYTFRKSANTLNQLYLETFDNGAYHENVTCFSHGMMTNRKYAFPYSDEAISDRYTETSRTITNSVHPSARGYQAWADGYYNMIRGFLTEDSGG